MGGCHFAGACKSAADCGHACAALGLDPSKGQCVPNPAGGKYCCCQS